MGLVEGDRAWDVSHICSKFTTTSSSTYSMHMSLLQLDYCKKVNNKNYACTKLSNGL